MTEAEWDACADPEVMLASLRGQVNSRKMRLFACACCRRIWSRLSDERSRKAVEAAERYADGLIAHVDLGRAWTAASEAIQGPLVSYSGQSVAARAAKHAADPNRFSLVESVSTAARAGVYSQNNWLAERAAQAILLRDLLCNPFRPVAFDPSCLAWNDSTVGKMAREFYADLRFGDLPILADALEEAGCTDSAILSHCRERGEHVRGCWVVDLLLGKA